MAEIATLIRGAGVVTEDGVAVADLAIGADGRIAGLGDLGSLRAEVVVKGDGMVAIPGGLDLHVHINTWFGGTTTRDDFLQGTQAALFGGTTTIAQFAIPRPGETSLAAVTRTLAEALPRVVADFAVHGCVVRETYEESLAELGQLVAAGIGTIKIFSAYTDVIGLSLDQIRRLLARAAQLGMTVFVHAETDAMVREGIDAAVSHGDLGPTGHAVSRSPEAETDAIRSIAQIARRSGAKVYFVHVSSASSVDALRALRADGAGVLAETCPHYLFLDSEVYSQPDGQRWICSPPIRSAEHRDMLWSGLRDGVIDTVSSDHNCYDVEQKGPRGTDFRNVPNGLPGIEHRLPLLIGAAIDGRLEWPRMVQLSSATPARILGLWPAKGRLAVGSDADVVLVDPAGTTSLEAGHMATDYSPYAGMNAHGAIREVWRRGVAVMHDGRSDAAPGSGAWLPVPAVAAVRA